MSELENIAKYSAFLGGTLLVSGGLTYVLQKTSDGIMKLMETPTKKFAEWYVKKADKNTENNNTHSTHIQLELPFEDFYK